jgi:hypothetical protein
MIAAVPRRASVRNDSFLLKQVIDPRTVLNDSAELPTPILQRIITFHPIEP